MACGCGSRRNGMVNMPSGSEPLALGNYPDCTETYSGPNRVVTVVDRGGPNERLFPGWELGEAAIYSSLHNDAPIDNINAARLCAAAVATVPT